MFKKLFVSLTVITLSTLTSFPALASTLSTTDKTSVYEFKYNEFKDAINNVKKLNNSIDSTIADEIVNEVSNNVEIENIEINDNTDSTTNINNENINPEYISTFIMESTAYTGGTLTATGTSPVRNENGLSTIAVDPSVIPLGSLLYIDGYGYAIAEDTGGSIKGNIIDLYLNSYDECINWGRQNVSVYLIAYPGQW